MKSYLIIIPFFLLFISCQRKEGPDIEQRLRTENFELRKENDSLKSVIARSERIFEGDTIQNLQPEVTETSYPTLTGKHALTLQWISWDKPGSAIIAAAEGGLYTIHGNQRDSKGNYLNIDGRVKVLNNRELEFEGTIESRVDHINDGQPCIRTGKKIFKATGTRKYWRLQDMINCEGGMVTDYVDIYF